MGEFELLARVRERLPPPGPRVRVGIGDDAAVTVPGGATALSDLAAMGAEPGEAYVVLGVPPDLEEDGCLELIDAIATLASETETTLAGGDLTRAPALSLAVTVVGHAPQADLLVPRSGARPGQALVLTGEIGAAAAGLLLLEQPQLATAICPQLAERLRARQIEPRARLDAGLALARSGATAMIDLSDGLAGDARHLAEASEAQMLIAVDALPIARGVAEIAAAAGRDRFELALCGGEDYELLAALPKARLGDAASALAGAEISLTEVGEVAVGSGAKIRLPGGDLLERGGFDQLR
jgi:thiamine-monophosphate kinase